MPDRPNVVWIVLEDASPWFGCYGDDLARTPRLDAFAADGRRYDRCYSTAGVCAPARSALMTGCYAPSLGTHHMRTDVHDVAGLPDGYEAVPPHYVRAASEELRAAGYRTVLDAKTDYQFGEPFTMWDRHADGESLRGGDPTAHWRDVDSPFFATYTLGTTHESGLWDPEADLPRGQFGGSVTDPDTDPGAVEVAPYLVDAPATRESIARYYDNLAAADAAVGDLLDALAADGLADETVVMVTADHGVGLPRCKRWLYDGGVRVPLLVRGPGVAGAATDRLVSTVDLAPTTLRLAGVEAPPWMQGRPFLDADGAPAGGEREYAFAARDRMDRVYDLVRMVTDGRYKYLRNDYPGPQVGWMPYRNVHPAMGDLLEREAAGTLTGEQAWRFEGRPREELYDLRTDPNETENLADDPAHAGVLDRLREALSEWRRRIDDRGLESETTTRREAWPDGQPRTQAPEVIPNAPGRRGGYDDALAGSVTLEAPARLRLFCATQGASVGYQFDPPADAGVEGTGERWALYHAPIDLPAGTSALRTKAIRYGYAESPVREVEVTVEG